MKDGAVFKCIQAWNATTRRSWNRYGTSDNEDDERRQCKRNNIIPKRLKSSGTIRRKYKNGSILWIERKNCWM